MNHTTGGAAASPFDDDIWGCPWGGLDEPGGGASAGECGAAASPPVVRPSVVAAGAVGFPPSGNTGGTHTTTPTGGIYSAAAVRSSGSLPAGAPGPKAPTGGRGSTSLSLDWLAGTFLPSRCDVEVGEVLAWLTPPGGHAEDWCLLDHGHHGYRRCYQRGALRVYFDGQPNMGIFLSLSGGACRQVEAEWDFQGEHDWRTWFRLLRSRGLKFTRVDVAMDDRGPDAVLNLRTIEEAAKSKHLTSCFHQCRKRNDEEWSLTSDDERTEGVTLYFGRRDGNMYIRMYDKGAKERVEEPWTRVEPVFQKDGAEAIAELIITVGFKAVPETVRASLEFKTPVATDTNRSRWPAAPWWDAFLDGCAKTRLSVSKAVAQSVERAKAWLERQAAQSLALLFDALDKQSRVLGRNARQEQRRFLFRLLEGGRERYRSKHLALLDAFVPSLEGGPVL